MQAVLTQRGKPRSVCAKTYLTFDSGFERGIDKRLWPDTGYPWIEDDAEVGQQNVINEERQFYVTRKDLVPHQPYRPWFVNDAGHLVLRCIPTPERYRHLACGVLDRFTIITLNAKKRRITVAGKPWMDPYTGERFMGINRYLRNNLNKTGYGFVCIGNDPKRLMYLRIEKEPSVDPLVSDGVNTEHRFEIIDDIPNPEAIKPGITTMTLLRHLPYVSGMLTNRRAFAQTYGSWHLKMRLPAGRGTLAGALLWPCSNVGSSATGVNLFEQPGHADVQYHSLYQPVESTDGPVDGLPENFIRPGKLDAHAHHRAVRIKSGHPHHVDARGSWVEVIWDWYPNNTCAWFIKVGESFLETARSPMPSGGAFSDIAPRMIVLKNAFDSWFNRVCELRDQQDGVNPFQYQTTPPWDFEVAFIRAYQWERPAALRQQVSGIA